MTKITSMTPEQEAQVEPFRQEWLDIGRSTKRIDMDVVTPAVFALYEFYGYKKPKIFYCKSPLEMIVMPEIMKGEKEPYKNAYQNNYYWSFQGVWGSYWLAFYKFPQQFLKADIYPPKMIQEMDIWIDLVKSCAGCVFYENACFISDRPTRLTLDDAGRLHNETESALCYSDDYQIYFWHGIEIPEFIIKNPEQISIELIEKESNAEIKRVMMEKYGWAKYLKDSGAILLDEYKDQLGKSVKLWKKNLGENFLEPLHMIELVNSTVEGLYTPTGQFIPDLKDGKEYFKSYMFAVPPTIETARKAHAFHVGSDEDSVEFVVQT